MKALTKITLIIALMITLIPIHQASARATGTIYGKVHYDGKGVSNILIEVMIGNCFDTAVFKALNTNDAGFYRVDGVMAGTPVNVAVNDFTKTARNKLYKTSCGKAVTLREDQLNRHDIALKAATTAKPTQQPSTTSTPTAAIYGKVHSKDQRVSYISVKAMMGSCLAPAFKTFTTNAAGFYRVDGVTPGKPVHIAVTGFFRKAPEIEPFDAVCSKGIKLHAGQLYRHNVALENSQAFKQCIANGGSWPLFSYITPGFKGCSYNYNDGGKACTDVKQCESGACLAVNSDENSIEGACATSSGSLHNSCADIIRNGRRFSKPCP